MKNGKGWAFLALLLTFTGMLFFYFSAEPPQSGSRNAAPRPAQFLSASEPPNSESKSKSKSNSFFSAFSDESLSRSKTVDANTCSAEELEALPHIGTVIAGRIVEYREKSGGFRSLDELKAVPGLEPVWHELAAYFVLSPAKAPKSVAGNRAKADLNTVTEEELTQADFLPEDLVKKLIRYRNACKGFKSFEHVAKTWGMTPVFLEKIKERYFLNPTEAQINQRRRQFPELTDLNRADSAGLERLPGLGPVLSARIVKYREKLGFYHSLSQLREVYNLKPEFLDKALPFLYVGTDFSTFPKIKINIDPSDKMQAHPYLRQWKTVNLIVKKRKENGSFQGAEKLYEIMDSSSVNRLMPYLSFELR